MAGLTDEQAAPLRVKDFAFDFIPKEDKAKCEEIKNFIERHEWLGKMPTRPTHRFIATYNGRLAGVIVMATPNSISNLLGEDHRQQEKLISRGACISWSPKNLGSALIMFAVRWMAKSTEFRYFTAYSDVEARELGTIYQACNFFYLGQSSGARFECLDPQNPDQGYFSDRLFRRASFIKRKAVEAGIKWSSSWQIGEKVQWSQIPFEIKEQIEQVIKSYQESCTRRTLPYKHKYVYILGPNKTETDQLRKIFNKLNPDKIGLKYPKERVPSVAAPTENSKDSFLGRPCRVVSEELTKRPNPCWPLEKEPLALRKKFISIKEVVEMYGISYWLIYHHIKTDPTFPVLNVDLKKKYLIDPVRLEDWFEHKTARFKQSEHNLISSAELLEIA